ncbi:UNVERIFIED_CONTAM: hypothetical protein Slati_3449400 [Sesamum latifolium]|uniref:Uncharacterized protein n=1 Tax=Sesamum latifolium TaxID=2727402 RepID=A0AAW2UIW6_9LAMI
MHARTRDAPFPVVGGSDPAPGEPSKSNKWKRKGKGKSQRKSQSKSKTKSSRSTKSSRQRRKEAHLAADHAKEDENAVAFGHNLSLKCSLWRQEKFSTDAKIQDLEKQLKEATDQNAELNNMRSILESRAKE